MGESRRARHHRRASAEPRGVLATVEEHGNVVSNVLVRCARVLALIALLARAGEAGTKHSLRRLYVRGVVAAHVAPRITTSDLRLDSARAGIAGPADGAGEPGALDGGVQVDSSSAPTAIVGYLIPGMPWRLSIETVVGAPSTLKIEATGRLASDSIAPEAGGVETGIPPLGRELAEAEMSAPILSVIVRPLRLDRVTFFGGLGASALLVYGEKVTNPVLTEVSTPKLAIEHTVGAVFQAGVETHVWRRFVLRLDAKYIHYRSQTAKLEGIRVRTDIPLLPDVNVGSAHMAVAVRPVIVQCGIGADF